LRAREADELADDGIDEEVEMRKIIAAAALTGAMAFAPAALGAASPTVAPQAATSIGETSAHIHGTVNPNGSATTYQFDWGLTDALGNVTPTTAASAGAGTAAVAETADLTGLSPDTTYYYELRASNASGTASTPVETFKTTGNPAPTSTTDVAAGVNRYTATLVGTIVPNNQATTYYFQYGLTNTYGLQTAVQTIAAGTTPVTVTTPLPAIAPGTVFHYRLVASHGSTSTTYGADETFQTAPFPRPATTLTMSVSPSTRASSPYLYTVSGKIDLATSTPLSYGFHGSVSIKYYIGKRVLASHLAPVGVSGSYSATTRVTFAKRPKGTHVTVKVRYEGDLYEGPSRLHTSTVVAGRAGRG
jgi:hypothetical protein